MSNVKIKGGTYGSIEDFEKKLKQRSSGPITKVTVDNVLTVRFLAEPSEWLGYEEHYTEEFSYFPCTDAGCPGCDENHRPSPRNLAPAVDVNTGKVIALMLTKQMGEILLKRWKRNKTLLDRDYELSREGETMNDTVYDAIPASPVKRNLSQYKLPDLERALFMSTSSDFRDYVGLEIEDEAPAQTKKRKAAPAAAKRRTSSRRAAAVEVEDDEDDEDYDDEEDDEEEEDETPAPLVRRRPRSAAPAKRTPARRVRK